MNLDEISETTKYFKDNLVEKITKISKIDIIDLKIKTVDRKEYEVSKYALDQLLQRLEIKIPINYLMKNFKNECMGQKRLKVVDGVMRLVDKDFRSRNEIIDDIIKLSLKRKNKYLKLIYDKKDNFVYGITGEKYIRVPNYDVMMRSVDSYGVNIDNRFSYIDESGMKLFFRSNIKKITPISKEKILFGYEVGNTEFGGVSLSISQALIFIEKNSAIVFDEIIKNKLKKVRIKHVSKFIMSKFKTAINNSLKESDIIDLVDYWSTRKPIFIDLDEESRIIKLNKLLQKYGINNKEYRLDIIKNIEDNEQRPLNGFVIGSAVNNYASNVLKDPHEANKLLNQAYQIISIQ